MDASRINVTYTKFVGIMFGRAGGRALIPKNAWAPYPCGFHQARRIPQEGQEAWEERSRRVAPQKGQTVSEAGGIAASFEQK
jgi:hypothetical protein